MGKPPVKSTMKLEEAKTFGHLMGEQKAYKKIFKKAGFEGLIQYFAKTFKPAEAVDIAVNVGLAIASYQAFSKITVTEDDTSNIIGWEPIDPNHPPSFGTVDHIGMKPIYGKHQVTKIQPLAALWGPVALKLIQAPQGTIPISAITGLGLLAALGLKMAGVELPQNPLVTYADAVNKAIADGTWVNPWETH